MLYNTVLLYIVGVRSYTYGAYTGTLLWSDEFTFGSLQTPVDSTKWVSMKGDGCEFYNCGWGNNEQVRQS